MNQGGDHDDEDIYIYMYMLKEKVSIIKARDFEKCDQFADYKKRIIVTDIDEPLLPSYFWYKDMQL